MSSIATFVVLLSDVYNDVARIARDRVSFDIERRRMLLPNDFGYPSAAKIAMWSRDFVNAAAIVLAPDGRVSDVLDATRATSEAWVEDAFIRALRQPN